MTGWLSPTGTQAGAFSRNYNLYPDGTPIDPSIGFVAYQPTAGQTGAQAYEAQQETINAFLANPGSGIVI